MTGIVAVYDPSGRNCADGLSLKLTIQPIGLSEKFGAVLMSSQLPGPPVYTGAPNVGYEASGMMPPISTVLVSVGIGAPTRPLSQLMKLGARVYSRGPSAALGSVVLAAVGALDCPHEPRTVAAATSVIAENSRVKRIAIAPDGETREWDAVVMPKSLPMGLVAQEAPGYPRSGPTP